MEFDGHTPGKLGRRLLAIQAINCYAAVQSRFVAAHAEGPKRQDEIWHVPLTEELVVDRAQNWPNEGLLRGMGGLVMGMVLWFASMAFGAVHIAAWKAYFPSTEESWLWRCSAIYIAASGLLWMMINLIAQVCKPLNKFWDKFMIMQGNRTSYVILGFICSLCGAAYVFARIFLVLEAFISLRQLPTGVYISPDWTQLIPHL